MDLDKYQELTGITVPASKQALVTAQINRSLSMMETMLGYSISSDCDQEDLYIETGKSRRECACPGVDIQSEDLDDPDEVEGTYRLFTFNDKDKFLFIDPFTKVYKVKLVYLETGSNGRGVTLRTFDTDQVRVEMGRSGWSKYLQRCNECSCLCECKTCVQLAVDADWFVSDCDGDIPDDLAYVLTDMVTYYSDDKKDIKSESITTHRYEKFSRVLPETEPNNLAIIRRYAGPNGSVTVNPVW